ncbi:hypothetical protein F2Q68_00030208 [Brassica cretica]|uniref:Uncharacterized protein n=1 Tax=Brassica cretica TaxID=69181 RepID=A0A8S9GAN9_BRACR|nr:hypothetical protein F2Q68_00030208 [Brassica cretica]
MFLSASLDPQTGVRHSTFESLRLGRSSQSIASGFLRFWDSLNFKKVREFVEITVLLLDEKLIKIILFDNFQVIANTNLELSDVVGQICYVQGSDLTKETTRVEYNDKLLMSYLAMITNCTSNMNEVVDKFNTAYERNSRRGGRTPFI